MADGRDDSTEHEEFIDRCVDDAASSSAFVVPRERVHEILARASHLDANAVLLLLARRAAAHARPPTSRFHVGAAARGVDGDVYLGVNVEVQGVPLNHSIHAEQFALVNAMACGARAIEAIATTEAPCGHCRQFMNEMRHADGLTVCTRQWRLPLSELLPHSFGPMDLISDGALLLEDQGGWGVAWERELVSLAYADGAELEDAVPHGAAQDVVGADERWRSLAAAAYGAMDKAYAPYSHSRASIAVRTICGEEFTGWSLECAAYNPSMSPLQVVISRMVAKGKDLSSIERVLLTEFEDAPVKYDCTVRLTMAKIAPKAKILVLNYHRRVVAAST